MLNCKGEFIGKEEFIKKYEGRNSSILVVLSSSDGKSWRKIVLDNEIETKQRLLYCDSYYITSSKNSKNNYKTEPKAELKKYKVHERMIDSNKNIIIVVRDAAEN